jgi:hypothetical protein
MHCVHAAQVSVPRFPEQELLAIVQDWLQHDDVMPQCSPMSFEFRQEAVVEKYPAASVIVVTEPTMPFESWKSRVTEQFASGWVVPWQKSVPVVRWGTVDPVRSRSRGM